MTDLRMDEDQQQGRMTLAQRAVSWGVFLVPILCIALFAMMVLLAIRKEPKIDGDQPLLAETRHRFDEMRPLEAADQPTHTDLERAAARILPSQQSSVRFTEPVPRTPGTDLWVLAEDPSTDQTNRLVLVSSDAVVNVLTRSNSGPIPIPAHSVAVPLEAIRKEDGSWRWVLGT